MVGVSCPKASSRSMTGLGELHIPIWYVQLTQYDVKIKLVS